MEKPRILSEGDLDKLNTKWEEEYEAIEMTDAEWEMKRWQLIAQAHLDVATVYYEPLIQQVAREIFGVYDCYTKLLGEEIDTLSSLAITHGWRSVRVKAGEKCRVDIQSLKSKYGGQSE
ncbi:MAG: hypothetical protein MUP17_00235 [candidate division Zixibacteria bacterium]|nr:hypothetical protein [candidate division Zixibacteria bacterium]